MPTERPEGRFRVVLTDGDGNVVDSWEFLAVSTGHDQALAVEDEDKDEDCLPWPMDFLRAAQRHLETRDETQALLDRAVEEA